MATESEILANAICKALDEKRGREIVKIYVREKTALCDFFVLASAGSFTQVKALGENVEEKIEKEFSLAPTRAEGVRDGRWAVVDYGDVIVHIMTDDAREFYRLERLWSDGTNEEKFIGEK